MATIRWLLPFTGLSFRPTFRLPFSSPPPSYPRLWSPYLPNSFLISQTPRRLLPSHTIHPQQQSGTLLSDGIFEKDEEDEEFEEEDDGSQKEKEKASTIPPTAAQSLNDYRSGGTPLILTIKEKKELASYAHSLGKNSNANKLVGKSGVTASVAASLLETLEANELLKLKVHSSCPGELVDVIKQLEVATGSAAVGQIGRTVILYRPSISKLKAAEKKRQNSVGRKRYSSSYRPSKTQVSRLSSQGRRRSKV